MERLRDAFGDKALQQSDQPDEMAIDLEDSSAMKLDQENGRPKKRHYKFLTLFRISRHFYVFYNLFFFVFCVKPTVT